MSPTDWLAQAVTYAANHMPPDSWLSATFNIRALLILILVTGICGAVGSLVVSNRMSFFSDALAHCAFAGVGLGMLTAIGLGQPVDSPLVPLIMVVFGAAVGVAIAYVREKTGLANDTVIGVFFAFAVGFGGMLMQPLQRQRAFNVEGFLFGSPLFATEAEILWVAGLAVVLAVVLGRRYNQFVLASFNPSLARSRNVPLRWCNYLLIVLLALVVNLSIRAVGALLINAMLVVPAATAANVSRNLRRMFWVGVLLSLTAGVGGLWLSNAIQIQDAHGRSFGLGPGGTVVVLSVLLFFGTVIWRSAGGRGWRRPSLAVAGNGGENASIAEPSQGRPA
ncbi:MAG TPA: metal ABC transporter permease [Gemmataceae bacterium]